MTAIAQSVTAAGPVPLRFQIGARTLMAIPRRLMRIPLSLDDARTGAVPPLPPLDRAAHGYLVTSLPADRADALVRASGSMLPFVRQRYTRWSTDLTIGFDGWFAGLSANTRQQLRRKTKRLAAENGGMLDIRSFRTPAELACFHAQARRISQRTYQERLLDSGLPTGPEFLADMMARAAADRVRAWLLCLDGEPIAYLYCPVVGDTVVYAHVGHDPVCDALSPGAVLQLEAFRRLFAEPGLARFDFTEGDGQHKRGMATDGVACVDLLLLRPGLANKVTLLGIAGFDRGVALAKHLVQHAGMAALAKRLRRGG